MLEPYEQWFSNERMTGYSDTLNAASAIASNTSCTQYTQERLIIIITVIIIIIIIMIITGKHRDVVSVSKSRSRDGLETYF